VPNNLIAVHREPPLDHMASARLKLKDAHGQLERFGSELVRWGKFGANDVIAHVDLKTRQKVYTYRVFSDPPPELGIMAGHFAYGLRSALNMAVHAVAQPDSDGLSFPIYRVKTEYINPRGKRRISARDEYLKGVAETPFRAIIDSYQPYQRGNRADSDPLALLSYLANTDKHVVGLRTAAVATAVGLSFTPLDPHDLFDATIVAPGQPLYDRTEVARVTVRPTECKVGMQGRVATTVALGERRIYATNLIRIERHVIEIIERLDAARSAPAPP
jgi:hypothetical protein